MTNPDKTKYLIPKLTTSVTGTGNDRESTVTTTSTEKPSERPVTRTSSTTSSTTGTSNETATLKSTRSTPQFKFDSFGSKFNRL